MLCFGGAHDSPDKFVYRSAQDAVQSLASSTGAGRGGAVFLANAPDGPAGYSPFASRLSGNRFVLNTAISRMPASSNPPQMVRTAQFVMATDLLCCNG